MSRFFISSRGFLIQPTPAGVLVNITVPGSNVVPCETKLINVALPNIFRIVLVS